MVRWYHGTSELNRHSILKSWFKPKKGIWGKGVYFSSSRDGASIFGPCILAVQVGDEGIQSIDYEDWIRRHPNQASWPKEIDKLQSRAIAVHYRQSNETELCVFDPDLIKQIFY